MKSGGKFIGKIGRFSVNQKKMVEWGSKSLQSSMMLCWQSRFGGLFTIQILSFIVFLRQNIFHIVLSLMQNNLWVHILGKASWRQGEWFLWEQSGTGDAKSIWVYKDSWLPGKLGGQFCPFFQTSTVRWGWLILDAYFLPFEAQWIKSIPLCAIPQVVLYSGHYLVLGSTGWNQATNYCVKIQERLLLRASV